MKRIGIALVMLIISGIVSGCEVFTVNSNVDTYSAKLDSISKIADEENYDKAKELSEEVLVSWQKVAKHLDKYLYHDYIDNITEEIATLPVYANAKDKTAVEAQVAEIKIQLTSLKESELPYMHNIL